ncbi:Domain of uncharacterised function (DUF1802) [Mycobacterium tuberculosis]|nr:Domain of uncharacterised function (DUF1802) [Mycobacterium tuberculosis]
MRDRREQQELVGRHLEALLADPALTQQHRLPAVQQRVHRRAPLLQRWRHSDIGPARGIVVTPALKEWSAAVHALLDGRQTVLLRKGGIGEKRFEVAAHEFLLFPTVAHSHAERVRPEHRDLLGPAAADSTDECVLLRAAAKVVAALPVNRPEGLDAIEDLHIWTAESVRADRLDFRPKHKLAVLVVSAIPLAEPVRLARRPEYGGCTSWVQLPVTPTLAAPVHDEAALAEVAARVREAVG